MSHGSAQDSVMMQVPNVAAFVRALLPVKLTEGHTVTFGVWLAIHPKDLKPTFDIWWDPAKKTPTLTPGSPTPFHPGVCWPARLKPPSVTPTRRPTVFPPLMRP